MPTPNKNEVVLFTQEELPTAEAEILSAIEKAIKQPTPNLLDISMALLSVEMGWRSNLRQTREAESFDANQSLRALQEKEQSAKSRFPDQAIAAGSADQLVTLQQQLRNEVASIAAQRADLETKRDHAQSDFEILFADLEKGDKLKAQFQKPAIVNANITLSPPTISALSRLFTVSPIKEETTLVLSPGQDLLTTARDTIAASKTRALSPTDDEIIIEVQKRRVGRPRLSDTPAAVHFNVSAILEDEGISLSQLNETSAQGVTVSLKALLRNDVGIENPTPDDMEKALRGIVRGDYRELLDNRRTLLILDGLAKPKTAPVKIEEVELTEAKTEEVVFTATPTVQPQRVLATPEPAGKRTMLDLAIVTDALTFDSHGRWKAGDLVSFSELTTDQRLSKEQGRAGNKRRDRQEVFAEVQTDFSKTVGQIIRIADRIGAKTIEQMLNSKTLEIPETQRQKLLPFAAVPVDQLPKVLDAIKMHGGISNRFKPVDQKSLLKFLLPEEKDK